MLFSCQLYHEKKRVDVGALLHIESIKNKSPIKIGS